MSDWVKEEIYSPGISCGLKFTRQIEEFNLEIKIVAGLLIWDKEVETQSILRTMWTTCTFVGRNHQDERYFTHVPVWHVISPELLQEFRKEALEHILRTFNSIGQSVGL